VLGRASSVSQNRDEAFRLLGEWGRAVVARDSTRAGAALDSARRVAATIDTMPDQSVRLALRTVDSAGGRKATLGRLAAAHMEYSDGFAASNRAALEQAADHLARAERELRVLGSAAAGWAGLYRASAEYQLGWYDTADHTLLDVLAGASRQQQPALVGKAVSAQGVIQIRRGNFELAGHLYRQAATDLARAKEQYNEGGAYYLLAESLNSAGQHAAGDGFAYRALRLLSPYNKSNFLNNNLVTVAAYARAYALPYAAFAVMDEAMVVGRGLGKLDARALAYRTRASDLFAAGRPDLARAELATAMLIADSLEGHSKERVRADIQLVQGQILRAEDPRAALPLLESVANAYRRMGADSKTSAAMYESAMAARDAGDSARARDWLVQSIAQIERQQTKTETAGGRAALFETADNAFDAMIDLELRAGRKDDAFAYLERERAAAKLSSYTRSTVGPGAAPSLAAIGQRLPRDMLFVEYALLPDRAIVWTSSRRGTNTYVISASRDSVAALVERFVHERSIPAPRGGDARSSLFTLLLGPLSNELEGVKQISVVGDRELSRLPFAALWDTATKQYVVERYRVRTEPSAAFLLAALSAAPASDRRRTALVVGNPAVDSLGIRLESLPGAEREARQVAKLYDAAPLIGPDARRDTVVRLLRANPSVFHFAGHAVFNGDRPELSFLALGPPRAGDGGSTGTLGAWEIGELRLSKLELVVLSACRTVSSRTSRTGGVAGLAASFLRAGAPAIISTLWDVSDDMTGPLLGAFHQRFAKGMSAAEALREAQVEALRQGVSPASWAAFIYAGP
jgi:CHAT domain-containing protein